MNKFTIGDKVFKPRGYKFQGIIVSVFKTLSGETRVVAEMVSQCDNGSGLLHIFSEQQLEKA